MCGLSSFSCSDLPDLRDLSDGPSGIKMSKRVKMCAFLNILGWGGGQLYSSYIVTVDEGGVSFAEAGLIS